MIGQLATLWPCVNAVTSTVITDAAGEYAATMFLGIPGKTVTKIAARCSASTAGVVDVQLETCSSYGPSGTLAGTNTSLTARSVSGNTNYEWTLTNSYTVPADASTMLAAVIRFNSGASTWVNRLAEPWTCPRSVDFGGVRNVVSCIGVGYSDGTWHPAIAVPAATSAGTTYNSGSTPDEYGNRFVPPANAVCSGVVDYTRLQASSAMRYRIYDSDLNVLTNDSDMSFDETDQITGAAASISKLVVSFNSSINLIAGRTYYITRAATNANNIYSYKLSWPSSAVKQAFHYLPDLCYRSNDTGGFTVDTLQSDQLSPLIDTGYGLMRMCNTGGFCG